MKVSFSPPEHGWIDMTVTGENFSLFDSISDVPNDFMFDLAVGLTDVLEAPGETDVYFSLEPGYFVFRFASDGTLFDVTIDRQGDGQSVPLFRQRGRYADVLSSLVSEVLEFYENSYSEPHWPEPAFPVSARLKRAQKMHIVSEMH